METYEETWRDRERDREIERYTDIQIWRYIETYREIWIHV